MSPSPSKAPIELDPGTNKRIAAINSKTPVPILPQGSIPSFVKIKTDSGAPVNL